LLQNVGCFQDWIKQMCGIVGFVDLALRYQGEQLAAIVAAMADTLRHRGPDGGGVWLDNTAGIALGHRRLAIVDLSPQGSQPMESACKRYVVTYNGEIYNHRKIRKELEAQGAAPRWRGNSDTEVALAAIATWGLRGALTRFIGMFAFALWDRQDQVLYLVRDRLGEKPLYFGRLGKVFFFASELKALRAHPAWQGEIHQGALALYVRHNYVPAPYSIYQGIFKLPPGRLLILPIAQSRTMTSAAFSSLDSYSIAPYWSAEDAVKQGILDPFKGSENEALEGLDSLLRDAVGQQMVADVPLGAFLSGGIDSSTIVAYMQSQSDRPVRTFTIGFHEDGINEARHAKSVARHLGTDHTELYVTHDQALEVIPRLPLLYDEPFSDSSQIPTFLLSKLTRNHVTVSLSGDAGDELFGGYNRHVLGKTIWQTIGWIPQSLRLLPRLALERIPSKLLENGFELIKPLLPKGLRQSSPTEKFQKLTDVLAAQDPADLYFQLISHWKSPCSVVLHSHEPPALVGGLAHGNGIADLTHFMMFLDTVSYLPDDILVKVDRAAMGVSLESRVPFLDHRVVEFAWRLPSSMKLRHKEGKWALRQLLYRYVPKALVERPKQGFVMPLGTWLRGPLRDWAEECLAERRLMEEGFFDPGPIRKRWAEHLSGKRNWQQHLWSVLMFQTWLEHEGKL
jgi:asparagine synthase (glutamine-hydrolysing)